MTVLVTGGAGFIGSAVVRQLVAAGNETVVTVDCLTYAGNLENLASVQDKPNHAFERVDIRDREAVSALFHRYQPRAVMHLAAESHVDRSIDGPRPFIETNIVGTFNLLEAARHHWDTLEGAARESFRFLHVSTDEVFGSLGADGLFTEESPYQPRSPYSSSKASADHLVRAWYHTFGLPVLITNCSNNYGPYQFPEKLIPVMILNAVGGKPLPIYGNGSNVRDWLYVEDHAAALCCVLDRGRVGETYNVGGDAERTNLQVVESLCRILDETGPKRPAPYSDLMTFVADRPGHDQRYAIDARKIQGALGWRPSVGFEEGLARTVQWYLEHRDWCVRAKAGTYDGGRLGLAAAQKNASA